MGHRNYMLVWNWSQVFPMDTTEFKISIKNAQHQNYDLSKTLQANKINDTQQSIKGKNVCIEGAILPQNKNNDDYYMMLKNQTNQTMDGHSIKIEHKFIHYVSFDQDQKKNDNENMKLCDSSETNINPIDDKRYKQTENAEIANNQDTGYDKAFYQDLSSNPFDKNPFKKNGKTI